MTNPAAEPWYLSQINTIINRVAAAEVATALREVAAYLDAAGADQVIIDGIYDRATAKDGVQVVRKKKTPSA